eukprot:7377341-Prymnesium_polylepis.1
MLLEELDARNDRSDEERSSSLSVGERSDVMGRRVEVQSSRWDWRSDDRRGTDRRSDAELILKTPDRQGVRLLLNLDTDARAALQLCCDSGDAVAHAEVHNGVLRL